MCSSDLPASRSSIILTLGDRLAMIEDRLAGIERMLSAAGTSAAPTDRAPAAAMRPPRTKQPASGAGTETAPAGECRGT